MQANRARWGRDGRPQGPVAFGGCWRCGRHADDQRPDCAGSGTARTPLTDHLTLTSHIIARAPPWPRLPAASMVPERPISAALHTHPRVHQTDVSPDPCLVLHLASSSAVNMQL